MKRWKISVLLMQQTKLHIIDRRMVVDLLGRSPFEFVHKSADRRAGGILAAWDTSMFQLVDQFIGDFSVSILTKPVKMGCLWAFSGVYGPNDAGRMDVFL